MIERHFSQQLHLMRAHVDLMKMLAFSFLNMVGMFLQVSKAEETAAALVEAEAAKDRATAEAEELRSTAASLEKRLTAASRKIDMLSAEADTLRTGTDSEEQQAVQELRQLLAAAEKAESVAQEQAHAANQQLAQRQEALSKAEAQVNTRHAIFSLDEQPCVVVCTRSDDLHKSVYNIFVRKWPLDRFS